MDNRTVIQPVDAEVIFWGIDLKINGALKEDTNSKIKLCEVHPDQPWVLCVDREGIIIIWDFVRGEKIFSKSMQQLVSSSERGGKSIGVVNKSQNPNNQKARFMTSRYEFSVEDNDFQQEESALLQKNLKAKEFGEIKKISFVDCNSLQWSCNMKISNVSTSFHTYSRVMIVSDTMVLFYDYLTNISHILNTTQLSKCPSTAEFIAPDLCAIGCVDGQIRIWDCLNWALVKEMNAHVKGEILDIKNIRIFNPEEYANTNSSTGSATATVSPSLVRSTSNTYDGYKEGKIHLVTVGYDGTILFWKGDVMGNIIQISSTHPFAKLSEPVSGYLGSYFDSNADTLITVNGNRVVKYWDITAIKSDENLPFPTSTSSNAPATPTKSNTSTADSSSRKYDTYSNNNNNSSNTPYSPKNRTASIKRAEFLKGDTTTSGGGRSPSLSGASVKGEASGVLIIRSIGKTIPYQLPPSLTKFSALSPWYHTRFPSHTFLACSKSNVVGVLVTSDVVSGQEIDNQNNSISDQQSIVSGVEQRSNNHLILTHEISIDHIMGGYLNQKLRTENLHPTVRAAARDSNIKVYYAQPHPMQSQIIALATSIGMIVLRVAKEKEYGPYVATHPTWRDSLLLYGSDRSLSEVRISMATTDNSITGSTGNGGGGGNSTHDDKDDRTESATDNNDFSCFPGNQIDQDVLQDLRLFLEDGNLTTAASNSYNTRQTGKTAPQAAKMASLLQASSTSRPHLISSPSGQYTIVYWPESTLFLIIRTNLSSNDTREKKMNEVFRGQCISIGWMPSTDNDDSSTSTGCDVLVYITPTKRVDEGGAKKKWIFSFSKKEDIKALLPPMLMLKLFPITTIPSSSSTTPVAPADAIVNPGGPTSCVELFGGNLLCITSVKEKETNTKQLAVSKIEREAQLAAAAAANTNNNNNKSKQFQNDSNDTVEQLPVLRSQFYALASVSNIVALVKVGPVMSKVSMVTWDVCTGLGAVLINNRINIVAYYQKEGDVNGSSKMMVLEVLASVNITGSDWISINSLWWSNSALFVSSPMGMFMIVGDGYNTRNGRRQKQQQQQRQQANPGDDGPSGWQADVIRLTVLPTQQKTLIDASKSSSCNWPYYPVLTLGSYEPIGISDGCLLLFNIRDGTISPLSLTSSPMSALGMLLSYYTVHTWQRSPNSNSNGNTDNVNTDIHGTANGYTNVTAELRKAISHWALSFPRPLHDNIAWMLVRRGLYSEALSLSGLSHNIVMETMSKYCHCLPSVTKDSFLELAAAFPQGLLNGAWPITHSSSGTLNTQYRNFTATTSYDLQSGVSSRVSLALSLVSLLLEEEGGGKMEGRRVKDDTSNIQEVKEKVLSILIAMTNDSILQQDNYDAMFLLFLTSSLNGRSSSSSSSCSSYTSSTPVISQLENILASTGIVTLPYLKESESTNNQRVLDIYYDCLGYKELKLGATVIY